MTRDEVVRARTLGAGGGAGASSGSVEGLEAAQ
jgi:hypothetical protein